MMVVKIKKGKETKKYDIKRKLLSLNIIQAV